MILNSDYLMLHKQSTVDRDLWAETLNLSDEEIGSSTTASSRATACSWLEAHGSRSPTSSPRAGSTTCSPPSRQKWRPSAARA